jgi:hypothetical protein
MLCDVSALQVFRAKFRVNARDLKEAYVSVHGIPHDILLKGPAGQNRAMEGDVVAIELSAPANCLTLRRQEAYVSAGAVGKRAVLQPDKVGLILMHQCIIVVMLASCVAQPVPPAMSQQTVPLLGVARTASPARFNFDAVPAMLQKVSAR